MATIIIILWIMADFITFGCLLEWSFKYPTYVSVLIATFTLVLMFPINLILYLIYKDKRKNKFIIYIEK